MGGTIEVEHPGPSMWRSSERFPLGGNARRATVLPDDADAVPFGLTRVVIVERTDESSLDGSEVRYDPDAQMSMVNGQFVIQAYRTDFYCWEQTTNDRLTHPDHVVDDSKSDS